MAFRVTKDWKHSMSIMDPSQPRHHALCSAIAGGECNCKVQVSHKMPKHYWKSAYMAKWLIEKGKPRKTAYVIAAKKGGLCHWSVACSAYQYVKDEKKKNEQSQNQSLF